jgi:hypothetical protein
MSQNCASKLKGLGDIMEHEQPKLELGPEEHIYHYPPPVPCGECGGRGAIALFTSARPCGACGGSGQIWPEPRHEHKPPRLGYWRRKESFDEQSRLITVTQWFEPVEPAQGEPGITGPKGEAASRTRVFKYP